MAQAPRRARGERCRRSIRLPWHDYAAPCAYFVTICARHHACLFGTVVDGRLVPSEIGRIVSETWRELPRHHPRVALDTFALMPNHVHAVLLLRRGSAAVPAVPTRRRTLASGSLGAIIGAFKAAVTRRVRLLSGSPGAAVWQRNYFEHIIRNQEDLDEIRVYIAINPRCWDVDAENPARA